MIEKELAEKYLMFMFFPNKTRQRGVIQQDAKDKGVEGDTDTEVICITEFRDQMKTLISLKGKKQGQDLQILFIVLLKNIKKTWATPFMTNLKCWKRKSFMILAK